MEAVSPCRTTHMISSSFVVFSQGGNATVIVTTYAKVMERIYVRVTV